MVVDLQNAFMDDEIGHAVCPAARDIVPEVNRLAGGLRPAGGAVFWIKNTFDATYRARVVGDAGHGDPRRRAPPRRGDVRGHARA